jgi:antitoxin HigA-1
VSESLFHHELAPIHPGEVPQLEFLAPLGLSQNRLALDIGVPARRINAIGLGKRRVSADMALRLGRYFDTTPQFWLGLQTDFDLDAVADLLGDRLDAPVANAASCVPFANRAVVTIVPRTAWKRYREPRRASRSLRWIARRCFFTCTTSRTEVMPSSMSATTSTHRRSIAR